ncbi:hypothetical protein PanWU01x14_134620 [Parasponia andersonii]|uniref:Uncharacterized protein n=1 Tax=Parasponia andersonii TaxID=3476 RepID=A0A2P5CPR3_PARAD|nr:hypothetical protein PanWU01x14_134620 [Parasponia andersonii]
MDMNELVQLLGKAQAANDEKFAELSALVLELTNLVNTMHINLLNEMAKFSEAVNTRIDRIQWENNSRHHEYFVAAPAPPLPLPRGPPPPPFTTSVAPTGKRGLMAPQHYQHQNYRPQVPQYDQTTRWPLNAYNNNDLTKRFKVEAPPPPPPEFDRSFNPPPFFEDEDDGGDGHNDWFNPRCLLNNCPTCHARGHLKEC